MVSGLTESDRWRVERVWCGGGLSRLLRLGRAVRTSQGRRLSSLGSKNTRFNAPECQHGSDTGLTRINLPASASSPTPVFAVAHPVTAELGYAALQVVWTYPSFLC